ncbi:hypothetical protein Tco_0355014 [Tanacetum coccineum]
MARQCTQPKRPRNVARYKEKTMLAEAQEAGQILDEEQLAFLADPGVQLRRTSLTGFPAQSVRSSNTDALDLPYLLVLNTGTSQSRQPDMSESDSYYLSD